MKLMHKIALVSAAAALSLASAATAQQIVKVDGSSTVYPITEAVAEDFQKSKKGAVKVTVGISGTGGGFKKFCRGETDVSNASRPILKEMEDCAKEGIKYIELPVAFDALTVVINPKNDFIKQLTVEELKKMWEPSAQGKVKSWKEINPSWPDEPLKLYGPAPTPARSITSQRPSWARPNQAAATTPPRKTTTCWCRACHVTRVGWRTSVLLTTSKTRRS